jgi:hypothetical protein
MYPVTELLPSEDKMIVKRAGSLTLTAERQGGLSIRKSDALLKQVITITSLKIITHLVFQLDKIAHKSLTQNVYSSIK